MNKYTVFVDGEYIEELEIAEDLSERGIRDIEREWAWLKKISPSGVKVVKRYL